MKRFWIIGGTIAVGAVAYGLYRCLRKKENTVGEIQNDLKAKQDTAMTPEILSNDALQRKDVAADFEQAQLSSAITMKERHKEAAQQLESTLSEMAQDTSEFEEKITQVNDDLDELLK